MHNRGQVLIICMGLVLLLVSLVGAFLLAAGTFSLTSGWEETDAKLLALAEAGLHKAVWNLKTPVGGSGQGENWTTNGATENLGNGSYTMVVARWDFALAANGSSAAATSSNGTNTPGKAIDGDNTTFWESSANVSTGGGGHAESITVTFPYTLTIDKARFVVPSGSTANRPQEYQWFVPAGSVTPVKSITANTCDDRTDDFAAVAGNSIRLNVSRTNTNNRRARIATLEAIGSKITSTGSITSGGNTLTRTVVQTVVALDGSTAPSSTCPASTATGTAAATFESDWVEQ